MSVREIQVKQVDRNIAHLSVNHDAASAGGGGKPHPTLTVLPLEADARRGSRAP